MANENSVIMPTPADEDCGAFVIGKDGRAIPLREAFPYTETATPVQTGYANQADGPFTLPEYRQL